MNPMLHFQYPFEEFHDHVKAMKSVRGWEHTTLFGELGTAQTSRTNSARVIEYFSDCYPDIKEIGHKSNCFLQIHDYVGANVKLFTKRRLLEMRDKNLALIDCALYRAVHFLFTSDSIPSICTTGRPELVADLAEAFKAIEKVS